MGGPKREGGPTHVDEDAYDPENPGESKAGRGGIVSPGGKQPKPDEDPRKEPKK